MAPIGREVQCCPFSAPATESDWGFATIQLQTTFPEMQLADQSTHHRLNNGIPENV